MQSRSDPSTADPPLCVDLDGTLVSTDLLWEGLFLLLRTHPRAALSVPFWACRGKAWLKSRVADHVSLDVETLPYTPEVLTYLKRERGLGRTTVLVTASDGRWARAVADHLGLFDRVLATDRACNLKGETKAAAIRLEFGGEFDYVGDSFSDLPVWDRSRLAVVVTPGAGLMGRIRRSGKPFHVIEGTKGSWADLLRLTRPHQWPKNLLLFVPVVTAHRVSDVGVLLKVALAFLAFCALASAVYILNDLLDLNADRRHASKRRRPLAAGRVSVPKAVAVATALGMFSSLVGAALPPLFGGHLLLYALVTTAYSLRLKQKMVVDVLCLAGLYALRISAGGAAAAIPISPWLQGFSIYFFLSLAFLKRYTELLEKADRPSFETIAGRGYMPVDLPLIQAFGPASGYLAVLVFSLYVSSPDVVKLYTHPDVLWLCCPVLLYWITRVWFLGQRGQLLDDPVLFAVKDPVSYLAALALAGTLALASYSGPLPWR